MSTLSSIDTGSFEFLESSVTDMNKMFVSMAHQYMMSVRFKVGSGYDDVMSFHLRMLYRIYNQGLCVISERDLVNFTSALRRLTLESGCLKSC